MTTSFDLGGLVVATALGLVVWLPAMWVAGARLRWTVPSILGAAFALAPAATGVAAMISWMLGSTLSLTIVLSAAQAVVLLVVAVRFRHGGGVRAGVQGIIAGLLAGGLAFWERPWFEYTADTFYHLAAARSLLATGAPLVTDPLHKTAATALDPTSGAFHTWLAAASGVTGVGVEYIYAGFTALAAAAVVWSFWALAERASGSSSIATLTSVGFVAFGLWGDFRMAGMPNRFTVAFLCLALLAILETTHRDRRRPAAALFVVAAVAALLTHVSSAAALVLLLAATAAAALAVAPRVRSTDSAAPLIVPALIALLLAAPTFASKIGALFSSHMTGHSGPLPEAFVAIGAGMLAMKPGKYIGGGPVAFTLMAVIAGWALYRGWRERDGEKITLGAFLMVPVILLGFPPVTTLAANVSLYMLARIALMMKFLPFLAAAWALGTGRGALRPPQGSASWKRWALPAAGASLLLAHALASWPLTQVTFVRVPDRMRVGEEHTVVESRVKDIRVMWGLVALWAADREFGDSYPIVAASQETGYYLAGLTDIAIVASPPSHTPLAIPMDERDARRGDMKTLLDPRTGERERREILDRWNADYVALSTGKNDEYAAWESMSAQTALFEPVVNAHRLVILRVVR